MTSAEFTTKEIDEPADDYARTKPFSAEEIRQFYDSENIEGKADEILVEQSEPKPNSFENLQTTAAHDDEDVLELPPNDYYDSPEIFSEVDSAAKTPANSQSKSLQNAATFASAPQLSSETIDMIVQKVVEKLSDKAVKEVAWEVVPQMADLIIKKWRRRNFTIKFID